MFSTRRRRRALVLVGIGYVGDPRRAARHRRPARGCIQRLDFFPLPALGCLHSGRPHVTDVDFSALSRALTRRFPPSHLATRAQRGRGAGVRRAPRVPRQPRGGRGGKEGKRRAGRSRRANSAGGGRFGRADARGPPVGLDPFSTGLEEQPQPDFERRTDERRRNGVRFAFAERPRRRFVDEGKRIRKRRSPLSRRRRAQTARLRGDVIVRLAARLAAPVRCGVRVVAAPRRDDAARESRV